MLPLESITVGQLLDRTAKAYPRRAALRYQSLRWSYARLRREVLAAAGRFLTLGVSKGTHVALWGELDPGILAAYYGLQYIGAVPVMLNTSLGETELLQQLELADCAFLLVGHSYKSHGDMADMARRAGRALALTGVFTTDLPARGNTLSTLCTTLPHVSHPQSAVLTPENRVLDAQSDGFPAQNTVLDAQSDAFPARNTVLDAQSDGFPARNTVLDAQSDALPAFWAVKSAGGKAVGAAAERVGPEDTALILFTSGSTSLPKAVLSSHDSRVNSGIQQAHDMGATKDDRFLVATPVFHCFCISGNVMAALAVGGCLCVPESRRVAAITRAVKDWRCTIFHSVPTLYHAILSKPDFSPAPFASLRLGLIGGAYYPPEAFLEFEKKLGLKLLSSLGQTETTAGLTVCNPGDSPAVRSTTVGHFMAHVEGKIIDPKTGATLPVGQVGEICVKGYLTMQGYYKQPELTAATLDREGFVHTGDLGVLDAAGNITLKGRLKELIIRNGENISPVEIETALGLLEDVEQCKVVGLPDAHSGEVICACIRRRGGSTLTRQRVLDHLAERLAAFKVPEFVVFLEKFPLSATGKIQSAQTAALAAEKLGRAGF